MALLRLQKGARFLRIEKPKNRSATGIAGRCNRAERHKRRLPLFLQSLRNGAGQPRIEVIPSFRSSILVLHTVGTALFSPGRTACTDECSLSTSDDKTASRSVTERMSTDRTFSHSRTSCSLGRFSPRFLAVSSPVCGFQGWGGIPALPALNRPHRGDNRLYFRTLFTWS